MKRVLTFTFIMLLGAVFLFVPLKAQEKQLNNTSSYELKPMSAIIYFWGYNVYNGPGVYDFDLSFLDDFYDYFIFYFGDNISRSIYLYDNDIDETLYYRYTESGVESGFLIENRNALKFRIQFTNSFFNNDYYILATNYDYIYNLPNNLYYEYLLGVTDGDVEAYDLGYGTGYQYGYDYGYDKGYDKGYGLGYLDGKDDAYEGGVPNYNEGYKDAMYDMFTEGFGWTEYDETQSYSYKQGWNAGVATNSDFSFTGLLAQIFMGLGSLLAIELLPNITIGAVIAVPIVFGIIAFIIGKRGGKDD